MSCLPYLRVSFVIMMFCWFAPEPAVAQDYPSKSIRLVVPDSPGTNSDTIVRILTPGMSKFLGQPIVIENKPGAGQLIGLEYVANQVPADGYTITAVTVQVLATMTLFTKEPRFDPLTDLPPVIGLVETGLFFGSSSKLPWKTFQEMVANARANPGKLNYGAPVSVVRLQMEALIRELGLDVIYVPYASAGAYVQGNIAGEVHMGFLGESLALSFGERFRVLAVTGDKRSPLYSKVPTFAELGYPQIRGVATSLNAPARVPKAAIDKLSAAGARALQQPEVKILYEKAKYRILNQSPEAASKVLMEQAKFFADIARKVGIQPQ